MSGVADLWIVSLLFRRSLFALLRTLRSSYLPVVAVVWILALFGGSVYSFRIEWWWGCAV
jgi:hypothetical protein